MISTDGSKRWRFRARGDISPVSRPETSVHQWHDQTQALDHLRAWAEARAVETITWYLRDKRSKRWASRSLRAAAVVFAVVGGVMPLVSASAQGIDPNFGYVLLAIAAGCVAFDHFFGLSSGWMRDIAALQALQNRVARFHLDWARWQARQAGVIVTSEPEASADATSAALDLIDTLMTDVARLTESETAQWIADFSSSVDALRRQANPSVTSPQDLFTWSSPADPSSG